VSLGFSIILLVILHLHIVFARHLGLREDTFIFRLQLFLSCDLIRSILSDNLGCNRFYILIEHVQRGFEILLVKVLGIQLRVVLVERKGFPGSSPKHNRVYAVYPVVVIAVVVVKHRLACLLRLDLRLLRLWEE